MKRAHLQTRPRPSTPILLIAGLLTCGLAAGGCSDEETSANGAGGSGANPAGGSGGSAVGGSGGSAVGGSGGSAVGGGGGSAAGEWLALVRGTLATTDPADSQAAHDALAAAGEAPAKAAGDFAHIVMLGTALLGTEQGQFMAMDRWTSLAGMQAFYSDPDFQAGFGALFAAPPTLEIFEHQPDWHSWGSLDEASDSPTRHFVVVRGHLAEADPAVAQAAHDAVAAAGEATATAAGDVGHVVFTSVEDPQELLAVDVWPSSDNLEAVYSNPDFQAAFASLFDSPPTLGVYAATTWHQW